MHISKESDILNPAVRKQVIEEIKSSENQARKMNAYKRYLCYRDQTDAFVRDQLLKQFDRSTVDEMAYCIANISLVRKIIDKLARVYNAGVQRVIKGDEQSTEALNAIAKELDFNSEMKKENKFLKLQKNSALYIKPCPIEDINGNVTYTIRPEPLNPYLYDVIEYEYDRRKPMAYIMSDFSFQQHNYTQNDAATAGRSSSPLENNLVKGNGKDELIADVPEDAKTNTYIWWSENYHFTTDENGTIVSESTDNPIKMLPFVNFAIDQDGQFWATGGDDLINGGILVNSILTHNQHISTTQGYGQFWMKGKNLPRNIKVGPSKAIIMEYEEGEPSPELGFASANPPIDSLRANVESYIALLLTTNNLSTSAVASQLGSNNTAPSGIAMMIDKSESREDTEDQQQIFLDNEPVIWEVIRRWLDIYQDNLVDGLKGLIIPEGFELKLKFHDAPVVSSEAEKLANLKARKELGLNTMEELIIMDNPDFSEEDAKDKMKDLAEEKANPNHEIDPADTAEDMKPDSLELNQPVVNKDVPNGNQVNQGQ